MSLFTLTSLAIAVFLLAASPDPGVFAGGVVMAAGIAVAGKT